MPSPAYTAIASQTLASSASSVTFSSIPGDYRDLVLVVAPISNGANSFDRYRFNGDTGANYPRVHARGNGSAASSSTSTLGQLSADGALGHVQTTASALTVMHIFDYTQTNKHKAVLLRTGSAASGTTMTAASWSNTAAITNIVVFLDGNTLQAGSTFSLFGISA